MTEGQAGAGTGAETREFVLYFALAALANHLLLRRCPQGVCADCLDEVLTSLRLTIIPKEATRG